MPPDQETQVLQSHAPRVSVHEHTFFLLSLRTSSLCASRTRALRDVPRITRVGRPRTHEFCPHSTLGLVLSLHTDQSHVEHEPSVRGDDGLSACRSVAHLGGHSQPALVPDPHSHNTPIPTLDNLPYAQAERESRVALGLIKHLVSYSIQNNRGRGGMGQRNRPREHSLGQNVKEILWKFSDKDEPCCCSSAIPYNER